MDLHFPRYHLRPALNWINDPNGMIYFRGRYHVFMQYNPFGALWGNIHWLHYSSTDLLRWKNHGFALSPDQNYDKGGCWSGCAIIDDDGLPVLMYSADDGQQRLPAIAYGDQTAQFFTKNKNNPVIMSPPMKGIHGFRDHKLFRWKDTWLHLIGSGNNSQGMILCYQSMDLKTWTYLGIWFEYRHTRENMIECPDLFEDSGHVIQIFSTNNPSEDRTCQSYYQIGRIKEREGKPRFEGKSGGLLDFDRMYAPQILQDDDNRVILLGWVREDRADELIEKSGWAGAMSLPRQLKVDELIDRGGKQQTVLRMFPVRELRQLRRGQSHNVVQHTTDWISQAEFLFQYCGADYTEKTTISWKLTTNDKLIIDLSIHEDQGTVIIYQGAGKKNVDFSFITEDDLIIHIFVDHSIVEIFINYSCCITSRIYPDNPTNGMTIEPNPSEVNLWQLGDLNIGE